MTQSGSPGGTTQFPYVVGFVLLVGLTVGVALAPDDRTRPLWIAGIALCSAGIATSLNRTAVVGLAVAWIAYGLLVYRDQHRYRSVLAATVLPFAVVAVAIGDPWLRNLQQTFGIGIGGSGSRSAAEVISGGRLKLIRHSLTIIADAPFVGVGPARDAIEAAARFPDEYGRGVPSVHVVPLLVAAEMGIAAGVACVGYLIALGWRSLRTSPEAVAVFASVAVFMLLDTMPYDRPTSIILVGVDGYARSSIGGPLRVSHSEFDGLTRSGPRKQHPNKRRGVFCLSLSHIELTFRVPPKASHPN